MPLAEGAGRLPQWIKAAGVVLALTAAVCIVLLAFSLPALKSSPRDVPIGLAGPGAVTSQVERALGEAAPSAFEITTYPDEQALRHAIGERQVYGGLSFGPLGQTVLIATAASPAVAGLIVKVGTGLAARTAAHTKTIDLRPLPAADPGGAGLALAGLPIALWGVLGAVIILNRFRRRTWLTALVAIVFALSASSAVTAILTYWFGSIDGDYWRVDLGLALGMSAISLTILGLESVAGRAGVVLGGVTIFLIGNQLSGTTSAPQLLPAPWGEIGQRLPAGANDQLLRSTAYFGGAGSATPMLVLIAWLLFGLGLCSASSLLRWRARSKARPVGP